MAKLTGMGGNITVSATAYPVSNWSINVTNDVQEVTDTGSAGWAAFLAAVSGAELTFTAFHGAAGTAYATTFAQGATVAASLAIGSGGSTVGGSFIVSSYTITNDAKTPVEFQCTAKLTGALT